MSTLSLRKIKHDSASVDNITLDSNGNLAVAGTIAQSKAMTTQYDGIGIRMGSSTANTNRGATFLQHTYVDAGSNQGNYVYNHSLRQNDGTYIANVYTADYSAGVHSWYHPNGGLSGNPVMQIDAAGRVRTPYQPCFSASNTNTAAYESITISAGFPFNTTRINVGSHFNTSTYRFTAPVAGLYEFSYSLFYEAGLGANNHDTAIYVNGADLQGGPGASDQIASRAGTSRMTTSHTAIISLSANDFVEVRARESTSAGIYGPHSMFCGRLIS